MAETLKMTEAELEALRLNAMLNGVDLSSITSDDEDDFDEPVEKKPVRTVKSTKESTVKSTTATKTSSAKTKTTAKPKTTSKITPLSGRTNVANMEVCVIKPTSVEDAREITPAWKIHVRLRILSLTTARYCLIWKVLMWKWPSV